MVSGKSGSKESAALALSIKARGRPDLEITAQQNYGVHIDVRPMMSVPSMEVGKTRTKVEVSVCPTRPTGNEAWHPK